MTLIAQITSTGYIGANFVHLIVASVLAWGFVAGQVATWGVVEIRGKGK